MDRIERKFNRLIIGNIFTNKSEFLLDFFSFNLERPEVRSLVLHAFQSQRDKCRLKLTHGSHFWFLFSLIFTVSSRFRISILSLLQWLPASNQFALNFEYFKIIQFSVLNCLLENGGGEIFLFSDPDSKIWLGFIPIFHYVWGSTSKYDF